ncbi:hypothetical protein [uncultured Aquimarina sp.]|uniref:hypothetical protein n=1 Tax=uncultured Aquimarina sp. TaxID=575652 RepID=UPI0026307BAB|nr:hypothetical protein [uncultured Aquimarina sp.]
MQMKYFFFTYILIGFISCKKAAYNSPVKSEVILSNSSKQIDDQNEYLKTYEVPFGSKELVTTEFPKDTSYVFGYNMKERPEIEKTIEKINKYYQIFNLWSKEDSTKVSKRNEKDKYSPELDSYNYYDIPLVTNIRSKQKDNDFFYCRPLKSFVKTGKITGLDDYELFTYTTFPKYYGNNKEIRCEGDNPVAITDLVIKSKKGKLIDMLNIYYTTNEPYNTYHVYPYIDENYKIILQAIVGGESYEYIRNEKWQIKPNGKFVRFYEKDGRYTNKEEQGEVKNSMREGKWIETKSNGRVDEITYLEAQYNEGEPVGEWEYYSFKNFKKGKLLYIEIYKNGELQKRTFVE